MLPSSTVDPTASNPSAAYSGGPQYLQSPRERTDCRLTTIKNLRATVRSTMHTGLTEIFASHTYVGLVDPLRRIVAIQSGVKLFLVDYGLISQEYFYQLGLADFGNYGAITFETPLDIRALIQLGVDKERELEPAAMPPEEWDAVPEQVTRQLVGRRAMLLEYFNLAVSGTGELVTLPLLMKGYTPSLAKLPRFLMRLGPCVEWNDEAACFESFLRELARFYTLERLPPYPTPPPPPPPQNGPAHAQEEDGRIDVHMEDTAPAKGGGEMAGKRHDMERVLEHVLFPALRARLVASKDLLRAVIEVADLKGLYRVFERC